MMVSLLWRLDGSFRIKECPAEGKADCVIFFQEIESNLRSMEVQFGIWEIFQEVVSETNKFRI